MYIELVIVAVIIIFIFYYNGYVSNKFLGEGAGIFGFLKEKDYDFLLIAKYGDRVYDANLVFKKRVSKGLITILIAVLVFLSNLSYIKLIIAVALGFLVFKTQYFDLKKFYKAHLNEIDSLLPYYLKGLEVLIQHYTVPVALARSIEDAPAVFKPGLKELVAKSEAGDSSIQPYTDFANRYPVRDSMRMMRLLYRLGLGEQERKHQQLLSFSKSVSNLQEKAREQKYKNRLHRMESMTMIMLVCTGGGGMLLLLVSMFMMLAAAM